ncbi:hypothetical protein NL393_33865, partial [Klebsiella pneumoniae]|nr:hypothetical protein [Klebsiella pneumoniae]
RVLPRRQMRQRPVLELGDDLLNQGVVAVTLIGLHHGQGAVGDEGVVAVGREQLALLGPVAGEWLESLDPADDQPAVHMLRFAATGERDEG